MSEEATTKPTPEAPAIASEQINELAKALATAQANFPAIPKNRVANVRSKKGESASYEYRYADLSDVLDAVRGPLSAVELAVTQGLYPLGSKTAIVTTLMHGSGQWVRSVYPLPGAMSSQEMGANITYGRRYSLGALIGVSAETDTDGATTSEPEPKVEREEPAPKPPVDTSKRRSAYEPPTKPEPNTPADEVPRSKLNPVLYGALEKAGVSPAQLKAYYVAAGHFADEMEPENLPTDYVTSITKPVNWKKAVAKMQETKA